MIPVDVANRLQVTADAAPRPVAPTQEIVDKLSDLTAGQRVLAEIQTLLPNGTYRAIINQRDVTLALPFSAKAGDSLELEVVDSDGKLTLALVSHQAKEITSASKESVSATLSRTGQLISNLFGKTGDTKSGQTPTPLNGNQPITSTPPSTAHDLLPLLKQAITRSGMFYESHQAEWLNGRLDKASLLQEPQGKLPTAYPIQILPQTGESGTAAHSGINTVQQNLEVATSNAEIAATQRREETRAMSSILTESKLTEAGSNRASTTQLPAQVPQPAHLVASEALPLVQQQLHALATQNFSWQGQVWPGQEMHWEIQEDASGREQNRDETKGNWQTRLRLTLPHLGEIDAQIRLQEGNQIALVLSASNTATRELLRTSANILRGQLDDAGLALASVGVGSVENDIANG